MTHPIQEIVVYVTILLIIITLLYYFIWEFILPNMKKKKPEKPKEVKLSKVIQVKFERVENTGNFTNKRYTLVIDTNDESVASVLKHAEQILIDHIRWDLARMRTDDIPF